MIEIQHSALTDHCVVVEILLEALPELHRPFVKGVIAGEKIIRSDDRSIATSIARTDPAFLQYSDVRNAMYLREVMGCCKPVPAAPDDNDIVRAFRRGIPPCRTPATVTGQCLPHESENRVAHQREASAG